MKNKKLQCPTEDLNPERIKDCKKFEFNLAKHLALHSLEDSFNLTTPNVNFVKTDLNLTGYCSAVNELTFRDIQKGKVIKQSICLSMCVCKWKAGSCDSTGRPDHKMCDDDDLCPLPVNQPDNEDDNEDDLKEIPCFIPRSDKETYCLCHSPQLATLNTDDTKDNNQCVTIENDVHHGLGIDAKVHCGEDENMAYTLRLNVKPEQDLIIKINGENRSDSGACPEEILGNGKTIVFEAATWYDDQTVNLGLHFPSNSRQESGDPQERGTTGDCYIKILLMTNATTATNAGEPYTYTYFNGSMITPWITPSYSLGQGIQVIVKNDDYAGFSLRVLDNKETNFFAFDLVEGVTNPKTFGLVLSSQPEPNEVVTLQLSLTERNKIMSPLVVKDAKANMIITWTMNGEQHNQTFQVLPICDKKKLNISFDSFTWNKTIEFSLIYNNDMYLYETHESRIKIEYLYVGKEGNRTTVYELEDDELSKGTPDAGKPGYGLMSAFVVLNFYDNDKPIFTALSAELTVSSAKGMKFKVQLNDGVILAHNHSLEVVLEERDENGVQINNVLKVKYKNKLVQIDQKFDNFFNSRRRDNDDAPFVVTATDQADFGLLTHFDGLFVVFKLRNNQNEIVHRVKQRIHIDSSPNAVTLTSESSRSLRVSWTQSFPTPKTYNVEVTSTSTSQTWVVPKNASSDDFLIINVPANSPSLAHEILRTRVYAEGNEDASGVPANSKWTITTDCSVNQFLHDNNTDLFKWKCLPCPVGANCDGDITSNDGPCNAATKCGSGYVAKNGYWRTNSTWFEPCPQFDACLGAVGNLLEHFRNTTNSTIEGCNEAKGYRQTCTEGNTCRLCATCREKYRRLPGEWECRPCMPSTDNRMWICMALFCLAIVLCGLIGAEMVHEDIDEAISDDIKKIMINYLQIIAMAGSFPMMWPREIKGMFTVFDLAASGGTDYINPACEFTHLSAAQSFYQRSLMFAIFPLIMTTVIFVVWVVVGFVKGTSTNDQKIMSIGFSLFLFYPALVKGTIALVLCMETAEGSFLMHDLQEPCMGERHKTWVLLLMLPMALLYLIGLPLLSSIVLWSNRNSLYHDTATKSVKAQHLRTNRRFGFLYQGFVKDRFWWESVVAIRKAAVSSLAAIGTVGRPDFQTTMAVLVVFVFLVIHLQGKPFGVGKKHQNKLHKMESVGLYISFFTMWCGLIFFNFSSEKTTGGLVVVSASLVIINVGYLVWMALHFVKEFLSERHRSKKRRNSKIVPLKGGDSVKKEEKIDTYHQSKKAFQDVKKS